MRDIGFHIFIAGWLIMSIGFALMYLPAKKDIKPSGSIIFTGEGYWERERSKGEKIDIRTGATVTDEKPC